MELLTLYLASDHAGLALKDSCKAYLLGQGYAVLDCGAIVFSAEDDFPDFISKAAAAVSKAPETSRGIIFGGSGQGEAMLANRYPNVRATVYYGGPKEILTLARAHNDANILSLGARFLKSEEAETAIAVWLTAEADPDPKYKRRNQKIETLTRSL